MIILGIDPGTATTGYGIIKKTKRRKKKSKNKLKCLDYGLIKTNPSLAEGERLKKIHNQLNKLIKKYRPEVLAIEKIYFFKNLKTAMPVAQAKGVVLLAAAKKKIPVYEFTPLQVKMAITGYGRAEKKQIQRMVKALLNLKKLPPDDAADALGIAICYTNSVKI
ncbi:crossover junction endodeoxyribonuclease RuvC [Patescibacteria group bacterium]|nr:crossover junction endodeoxyribonuclease RuvC [Patescibacteria group bacterium]